VTLRLPPTLCFRVTGACNARCGFCLAPPSATSPRPDLLVARLDWLLDHGVRTLHFCGGEPSLHPALPMLLARAHDRGAGTRLTTNGIVLPAPLLSALEGTGTAVRVSLHGDREGHNALVGCDAFDRAVGSLRRLLASGIDASVQSTLVATNLESLPWIAGFCLENGVRRLSLLPFIPRGRGGSRADDYRLSSGQRRALRTSVRGMRRELGARLDVRWLDFSVASLPVVGTDGRLILEGGTEGGDRLLCRIPVAEPGEEGRFIP